MLQHIQETQQLPRPRTEPQRPAKPATHHELRQLAAEEVAAFFPTKEVDKIHEFFYNDGYRFLAMVNKIMGYENDSNFLRKAFKAFFTDDVLSELMYPPEWYISYSLVK